ncbi:hypothetical protein HWC21_gp046 [Vibrio phage VAP7]|uniref:Uncharacterized protein n=1 Tax=Vibrio phage VAP7 TaxID=2584487 RepID=A0A4Y5TV77_9CAUD|nr:hypothetical protein [Bacillus subtilis]YP_009845702.1 hypothetical protein HWC21_gp046 [Vibrio phage VAP7]QDB73228.1 hypothetical protein [Vibrio phage VAP7]
MKKLLKKFGEGLIWCVENLFIIALIIFIIYCMGKVGHYARYVVPFQG